MDGDSDELLRALQDSRYRFQKHMQRLFAKYNQPFEDAPVVQMSTLTYQTPQGLRIWGGSLVKENDPGEIQPLEDCPWLTVGRNEDPVRASASRHPRPCTPEGADSDSGDSLDTESTFSEEDTVAETLEPVVMLSPLKDDLRRKYLTQVDLLLQGDCSAQETDDRGEKDTSMTLVHSPTSPSSPPCGCNKCVSAKSPGDLRQLPSPPEEDQLPGPHPHSSDTALAPRSHRLSLQGAGNDSLSPSPSFEGDSEDMCNVTLSDMYEGMLHSMSRLLSAKPSCIISTKTFILRNWGSRRRARHRAELNRTFCRASRPPRRTLRATPSPSSEPVPEKGPLRDCQNHLLVRGYDSGFGLDNTLLGVSPTQAHRVGPIRKESEGTPHKDYPPLFSRDRGAGHLCDQENRLATLKWLISPVKIVSKQGVLQSQQSRSRETEVQFHQLHQKFCAQPRMVPMLPPGPSAVEVYKGVSPRSTGSPAFKSQQPSTPIRKASAKSLSKTFENLSGSCREAGGRFSPSSSKMEAAQSPGRPRQISSLGVPGASLGILQKSVSPGRTFPLPRVQPLSLRQEHYKEIKENFDKLYQKYCQKRPWQDQPPSNSGNASERASHQAWCSKEDSLGESEPASGCYSLPKQSSLSRGHLKSALCTRGEVQSSTLVSAFSRVPESRAKRPRLSDPQGYGWWTEALNSSPGTRRAGCMLLKEVGSLRPNGEERKRQERPIS